MTTTQTSAVMRTEARLFSRELGSVTWIVLFPTVLLAIIGAIPDFREADPNLDGRRVVDLYVPVAVLLSMIMAAILAMPLVVVGYRERGILRRMRTTPVSPGTLLGAQALLHAAAVVVSAMLVLSLARLVFSVALPRAMVGYIVALTFALAVAFGIGALIAAVSPNARIGNAAAMIVLFPAMFTAGVWVPVQALDGLLRTIVERTPLGAASIALDQATLGAFPAWSHLGIMAGWTALCFVIAARIFRWT